MFPYIIDEALYLRMIEFNDAEEIFRLTEESRSYLKEFLPWLDFTVNLEDTQIFIQGSIEKYARNEGMVTVVVYQDKIVGLTSFNELDWENKTAYIGYWLGKQHQGKGIMTRAVEALTDYAFKQLGMEKVDIRAAVQNRKSQAIPERLGFKKEGTIHQAEWLYDRYVDHVVFSMVKENWFAR